VPIRFTPTASVFKDRICNGVNIILTDRDHCPVVDIGMAIAGLLHRWYPQDFNLDKFNVLLGHPATVDAIRAGKSLADIHLIWKADRDQFQQRRARYLLY